MKLTGASKGTSRLSHFLKGQGLYEGLCFISILCLLVRLYIEKYCSAIPWKN